MHSITLIGATGSIGRQTLAVIDAHPDTFRVAAVAARADVDGLFAQCIRYHPAYATLEDQQAAHQLRARLQTAKMATEVVISTSAVTDMIAHVQSDVVVCATTGSAGVHAFRAALATGKRVLLANKEALVMAGPFFYQWQQASGASVIPIDSEHYAIMQALPNPNPHCYPLVQPQMGVRSIVLTASGGAFLHRSPDALHAVTVAEATSHPNWSMGQKVTIDSATLMNKALEVIEAHWLFGVAPEAIDVYIHPSSVIHGMVVYQSGSVVAQMSEPDMHIPIAGGLGYPQQLDNVPQVQNQWTLGNARTPLDLQLLPLDEARFPAISLARHALGAGGSAPLTLNAVNEIAVAAFCDGKITFSDIVPLVTNAMNDIPTIQLESIEAMFAHDAYVRRITQETLAL